MKLGQTQRKFSKAIAELILFAYACGYEVTFGDAYRDPRLHGEVGQKKGYGAVNSCHKLRLAVDLNLFKKGRFLTSTASHKFLGEWWEEHGKKIGLPLSWGGHFNDGNHYSCEWQGKR